jgi:hypothetical protein
MTHLRCANCPYADLCGGCDFYRYQMRVSDAPHADLVTKYCHGDHAKCLRRLVMKYYSVRPNLLIPPERESS